MAFAFFNYCFCFWSIEESILDMHCTACLPNLFPFIFIIFYTKIKEPGN